MPWHVVSDHAECGAGKWAVVKDGTGEVEGCHMSEADAQKHMAALYANDGRAQMSAASINDLPDSAFAYIEPGGKKDDTGRTVPRSKRHFPIHDAAHVRNALARAPQSPFGEKAMPKILAAARKFGIEVSDDKPRSRPPGGFFVRAFEFESRANGDGRTLEGYAAVFGKSARIRDLGGDFDEVIAPGAFARSLSERTPVLQFEHGKDPRVGAVPIGAIDQLREDDQGLFVRARLFDNAVVEPVRQAISGKAIRGMSFRFSVPDGGDKWSRDGKHERREIRDADVYELGPVVFPAYDATSVGVRSLLAQLDPDDHRALLRELAAELRLAADPEDLTGRPDARSAGGGESGTEPGNGDVPTLTHRQRLDDGALRLRRILK